MSFAFRIMAAAARLLIALGAICLLLGVWLASRSLDAGADSVRTTGRVVSYLEKRVGDTTNYRPVVKFTTPRGDIVTIAGELSTASKRFAIGAEVPVVYPAGAPMKGQLATYTDKWLGATVAGVVGILALLAGVLIRRAARRQSA